jgi:hypothetical protein
MIACVILRSTRILKRPTTATIASNDSEWIADSRLGPLRYWLLFGAMNSTTTIVRMKLPEAAWKKQDSAAFCSWTISFVLSTQSHRLCFQFSFISCKCKYAMFVYQQLRAPTSRFRRRRTTGREGAWGRIQSPQISSPNRRSVWSRRNTLIRPLS